MDVRKRINDYLIKYNWTINRLACEAGITQSTLYKIMSDKDVSPNLKTLEIICQAFKVSINEFFSNGQILSEQERLLLSYYNELEDKDKEIVISLIKKIRRIK